MGLAPLVIRSTCWWLPGFGIPYHINRHSPGYQTGLKWVKSSRPGSYVCFLQGISGCSFPRMPKSTRFRAYRRYRIRLANEEKKLEQNGAQAMYVAHSMFGIFSKFMHPTPYRDTPSSSWGRACAPSRKVSIVPFRIPLALVSIRLHQLTWFSLSISFSTVSGPIFKHVCTSRIKHIMAPALCSI